MSPSSLFLESVPMECDCKRGKRDEEQMMMHLPIEPSSQKRICLTKVGSVPDAPDYYDMDSDCYYGEVEGKDEAYDEEHLFDFPLFDFPIPDKRLCINRSLDGSYQSVPDADCYSDSDSDSDSEDSDYDCYYDDLPTIEERDRLNNEHMEEMVVAAAKACKDSGDGQELKDLQVFKVNSQGTGTETDCYIIFRAKGSLDGKTRCYVAQVITIYDYDSDPFYTRTVEFVRLMDDPSQVTASEWPEK